MLFSARVPRGMAAAQMRNLPYRRGPQLAKK